MRNWNPYVCSGPNIWAEQVQPLALCPICTVRLEEKIDSLRHNSGNLVASLLSRYLHDGEGEGGRRALRADAEYYVYVFVRNVHAAFTVGGGGDKLMQRIAGE